MFFAARLLLNTAFFGAFVALYGRQLGLTYAQILAIEASFAFLVAGLDLPTAHWADRNGPRQALLASAALQALACLALFLVPAAPVFLASQALFAASVALGRGADSALNFQLLSRAGRGERFEASERFFGSALLAIEVLSAAVGGAVSAWGYEYPFLATAVGQALALALLARLPRSVSWGDQEPKAGPTLRERLALLARVAGRSPGLARSLALVSLAGAGFYAVLYLAPPLAESLGLAPATIGITMGVASLAAAAILARPRLALPLFAAAALGAIALGGPGKLLMPVAVTAGYALARALQGLLMPRLRSEFMGRFRELGETTAMSVLSTASALGFAVAGPLLGGLADRLGLGSATLLCGGVFAGSSLLLLLPRPALRASAAEAPAPAATPAPAAR